MCALRGVVLDSEKRTAQNPRFTLSQASGGHMKWNVPWTVYGAHVTLWRSHSSSGFPQQDEPYSSFAPRPTLYFYFSSVGEVRGKTYLMINVIEICCGEYA